MNDISKAIQKLLSYSDTFAVRGDFSLIHAWIADGCDLEKDILPSMDEMMARNKNITSVAYFGPRVFRARDNRRDLEKAKEAKHPDKIDPYTKARLIAWKGRKLKIFIPTKDEEYLSWYEKEHGTITL